MTAMFTLALATTERPDLAGDRYVDATIERPELAALFDGAFPDAAIAKLDLAGALEPWAKPATTTRFA